MALNPIVSEHLRSALLTFLTAFLTTLGASLSIVGTIEWTAAFWSSLILVAARAALKEVFAKFMPLALGGRIGPTIFGSRHN